MGWKINAKDVRSELQYGGYGAGNTVYLTEKPYVYKAADASMPCIISAYPIVKPIRYKITYVTNGGTLADNAPGIYRTDKEVWLGDATRNGYTFGGWTVSGASPDEFNSKTYNLPKGVTGDITCVANWIPVKK